MNDQISSQIIELNKLVKQISRYQQQGKPSGKLLVQAHELSQAIDCNLKLLNQKQEVKIVNESDKLQKDFQFLRAKLQELAAATSRATAVSREAAAEEISERAADGKGWNTKIGTETRKVFPADSRLVNPNANFESRLEPHEEVNETHFYPQKTHSSLSTVQQQTQLRKQYDVIDQDEITYQTQLQRERHQEIQQLHRDCTDVNQIFQQLNTMLVQQGEQLETVDENTNLLLDNVQRANTQLDKAKDKQKSSMCCRYILFLILFLLLLVLLLLM